MLSPDILVYTMISVMYRLIGMQFEAGSVDEAMRLGLLSFSQHVFLQWQGIQLPCLYLITSYKDCLASIQSSNVISPELMIWLLVVVEITSPSSVDGEQSRESLRECLSLFQPTTWDEMRGVLKSTMWIDRLHDLPGREALGY